MKLCDQSFGLPAKRLLASIIVFWVTSLVVGSCANAEESEFAGLIRTKAPDRGSYQAPTVAAPKPKQVETGAEEPDEAGYEEPVILRQRVRHASQSSGAAPDRRTQEVAQAAYQPSVVYEEYAPTAPMVSASCGSEPACGLEPGCGLEAGCGCESMGYQCDGSCMSCEPGCDSMSFGSCGNGRCGQFACGDCNARLSMDPCQWFGTVELLLMWRVGDGLPPLVTTSNVATGEGVLNAAGTEILFGGDRVMDELTAGGRFTIGTWLDDQQCRSLVLRGWGAEQDDYRFSTNDNRNAIIARPFLNVEPATPVNGSLVIASPARNREGSIDVEGSNDVYGADISLRQRWLGGLGGFVDVLYGYQYMRMDDNLRISSSTFDTTNQPGTLLDVTDRFDAENEFHGGQLGLAARYREGCWSFNGIIKAAAGSMRRTSVREGSRVTTIGPATDVDPNGLLVRSTNAGSIDDRTFGWVPELDASLGWRWTPNLELTFGYHAIGMTDALQVSGMIDPQLAVNAAEIPNGQTNPPGRQNPSGELRFDTFYIHGIHFGVQCVY